MVAGSVIEKKSKAASASIERSTPLREAIPGRFKALAQKRGVESRISFFSGRDDVSELMMAADVLIHPAYQEAAGLSPALTLLCITQNPRQSLIKRSLVPQPRIFIAWLKRQQISLWESRVVELKEPFTSLWRGKDVFAEVRKLEGEVFPMNRLPLTIGP